MYKLAIIFLGLCMYILATSISKDLPQIKLQQYRSALPIITVSGDSKFQIDFQQINFEISGSVLKGNTAQMNDNSLFMKQSYTKALDCSLRPTQLQKRIASTKKVRYYITSYLVAVQQNKIYLGGSTGANQKIQVYKYDSSNIEDKTDIPIDNLKFTNFMELKFVEVGKNVYATDGSSLYRLPANVSDKSTQITNFPNIINETTNQNPFRILGVGTVSDNKFWLLIPYKLIVFQIKGDTIESNVTYLCPKGQIYFDVAYDPKQKLFYLLTQHNIIIQGEKDQNAYQIENGIICNKIRKTSNTLHLICQITRVSFVAEYFIFDKNNKKQIILNRYYNNIDGVTDVYSLGINKQMLITSDEINVMGLGIPRQVLLDYNKKQLIKSYLIQPLLTVVNLPQDTLDLYTTIVTINIDQISLVKFIQIPPKIVCDFQAGSQSQILMTVVFNSSSCPKKEYQENQVCQYWYPMLFKVSFSQIDKNVALIIVIIVIVIIVCFALFCLGCGFQKIQKIRVSMYQLGRKLKRIKSTKQTKPI